MYWIIYIALYLPLILGNDVEEKETQILINTAYRSDLMDIKRKPMVTTENVNRMIGEIMMFVDKTPFIEKILRQDCPNPILITAPRKWGKSVNFRMLEYFASIPFINSTRIPIKETRAYSFFKKGEYKNKAGEVIKYNQLPMVAKNQTFVDENLGKWTVILLEFSGIEKSLESFEDFLHAFKTRISSVFRQHDYIVTPNEEDGSYLLNEPDRSEFHKWLDMGEDSLEEIEMSIITLSNHLQKCFGKPALLLIDDYDNVFYHMYYEQGINNATSKILSFYHSFLAKCLQPTNSIAKTILTGILPFPRSSQLNLTEFSLVMGMGMFQSCYGFSSAEVEGLLINRWIIESHQHQEETIITWYKGYHSLNDDTPLFNPWSITRFVTTGKADAYWYKTGIIEKWLLCLHKYLQIRYYFQHLLAYGAILIKNKYDLIPTEDDFRDVGNVLRDEYREFLPEKNLNAVFSFLCWTGYLTVSPNRSNENETRLIIPNLDVRLHINNTFIKFVRQELTDRRLRSVIRAANSLHEFLFDEQDLPTFMNYTRNLFSTKESFFHIRSELQNKNGSKFELNKVHHNQTAIRLLMDLIAHIMIMNHDYIKGFESEHVVKFEENPLHLLVKQETIPKVPLYFFHTKNRAVIIELETDPQITIDKTLERAINYTTILKERVSDFELVKYIAFKYNLDETLDVKCETKSQSEIETYLATSKAN